MEYAASEISQFSSCHIMMLSLCAAMVPYLLHGHQCFSV